MDRVPDFESVGCVFESRRGHHLIAQILPVLSLSLGEISMRPDWDSYFMKIAYAVSERSTCDRAYVGCVLVYEKRILTTGFNGSPAGQEHCDEIGHLLVDGHCVRTIHAETNAIIQAALHGISTRGCTCYVTHFPCLNCTKVLINAGITRLIYSMAYRMDENAMEFLHKANVEICELKFTPGFTS
jgi:dCMP deaminase